MGLSPDGTTLYVGDQTRNLIWAIDTDTWIAHHFAGMLAPPKATYGSPCDPIMAGGYAGDGGPATQAQLACPTDLAVGPDGSVYIEDSANACIRVVSPDGIIERFAGQCTYPDPFVPAENWFRIEGDGGPRLDAWLGQGNGSLVVNDGFLYIGGLTDPRTENAQEETGGLPQIRRIRL